MTNARHPIFGNTARKAKKRTEKQGTAARIFSAGTVLGVAALLLRFTVVAPKAAAEAARAGLFTAGNAVLPSLFPFFVLSSLLIESGIGERLLTLPAKAVARLFRVSRSGACAILLGAFCGFPVGARVTATLYRKDLVTRAEAERLLALSNAPSFAFLYGTVGAGFFGSAALGLRLYLSVLLSTWLTGLLLRPGKHRSEPLSVRTEQTQSTAALFSGAITSAAHSALTVTASLVFFSVTIAAADALLAFSDAPTVLRIFLTGALELTSGIKKAAETSCGLCGICLCGFFAGFGGLCAHLQVIATAELPLPDRAEKEPITFRSYFLCKGMQGIFTALLFLVLSRI